MYKEIKLFLQSLTVSVLDYESKNSRFLLVKNLYFFTETKFQKEEILC